MIALVCLSLLGLLLSLAVFNIFTVARLESEKDAPRGSQLRLSVLIPARNEAHNLKALLPALLNSRIQPYEIILLDDNSDDETSAVARQILEKASTPFRILRGDSWSRDLGLTGKSHACWQLAEAASGDIFLFCDADVLPSQNAIGRTLNFLSRAECAGLSGLPKQITCGERERLTLPWIVQIPLLTLLPLSFGWRSRFPSLQMANGQWLAVHRDRYEEVGGHRALGGDLLDDVALARRLADRHRGGLVPVLSVLDLSVKMYLNWDDMRQGFSKNIVQMYGGTRAIFSLCLFAWVALFSFPLWGLFFNPSAALAGAILILAIRLFACSLFQERRSDLWAHARSLFWLVTLGANAVRTYGTARIQWKGRDVSF